MRLIDADELIDIIKEANCKPCIAKGRDYKHVRCRACQYDDEIADIEDSPTVDDVPGVHGHWITDGIWDVCSICNLPFVKVHINGNPTFNFCPNCGANMNIHD